MLKLYIKGREAAYNLRNNQDGVVSFEYVIVAACIVAAVAAAFGTDATTGLGKVLAGAIKAVGDKVTAAL